MLEITEMEITSDEKESKAVVGETQQPPQPFEKFEAVTQDSAADLDAVKVEMPKVEFGDYQ
jgi:hypothetical protein